MVVRNNSNTNPDVEIYEHKHEIQSLQEDISAWAFRLYGNNRSEQWNLVLGSISPLLGIVAKLGELESVESSSDLSKAIGDIFLYVCDYANREDIILSHIGELRRHRNKNAGLIAVGKMTHATIHYHRGLIQEDEFKSLILNSINELIAYLNCFTESKVWGKDLILIFREAWQGIIKKQITRKSKLKKKKRTKRKSRKR